MLPQSRSSRRTALPIRDGRSRGADRHGFEWGNARASAGQHLARDAESAGRRIAARFEIGARAVGRRVVWSAPRGAATGDRRPRLLPLSGSRRRCAARGVPSCCSAARCGDPDWGTNHQSHPGTARLIGAPVASRAGAPARRYLAGRRLAIVAPFRIASPVRRAGSAAVSRRSSSRTLLQSPRTRSVPASSDRVRASISNRAAIANRGEGRLNCNGLGATSSCPIRVAIAGRCARTLAAPARRIAIARVDVVCRQRRPRRRVACVAAK